jgi:catechol 2,3-dioxygenase-like lactoylglutathione lyase family enzyme
MSDILVQSRLTAFVASRDAARSKAFYGDTLGLTFVSEDPFAVVFDSNGTTLRVSMVPKLTPAPYTVLWWEVSDITAAVLQLQGRGVRFEVFPGMEQDENGVWLAPGGTRVAWFKDPEGNILSISQH